MLKINGSIQKNTLDSLEAGQSVSFSAYVQKAQSVGKNYLLTLSTGKDTIGALYTDECDGKLAKEGKYVSITGTVYEKKRDGGGLEIRLESIKTLSQPLTDYPINIFSPDTGCTTEEAIPYRDILLRREDMRKVFLFSSEAEERFCGFMRENNFTNIHTPNIVPFNVKRGLHEFRLDYFGNAAVLSKSPQVYLQSAAAAFGRVFEITHSYRAQKHYSTRHLNEFITLNFELSFTDKLSDILNITAGAVMAMANINCEIPSFTFYEVCDILNKAKTDIDLNPTEELKLSVYAKENFDTDFVFVTNFPEDKRPFYEKNTAGNPRLTNGFSLLYHGVEVASGGVHIHSYDEQKEKLIRLGYDEDMEYLKLLEYAIPPQGGAAIGLERFVTKHLGLDNIKEASLFPRDIHNIIP